MHWYEGSIPAAIAEAKEKKKLFLVYIEGKDELSKQMTSTYNDAAVADRLASDGCVSLKLESDSESCKQFSQIYPVCIIPSSFFIGNDGIPLEVIAGNLEPEKFLCKIDKVIKLHSEKTTPNSLKEESKQEVQEASGSGAVSKNVKTDTETAAASLNTETTSTYSLSTYQISCAEQEKPMDVEITSDDSASEEPKQSTLSSSKDEEFEQKVKSDDSASEEPKQSTSSSSKDEEFEQKVKRARKLIEEKNIQREEEAKKKEIEREKERRKTGRELQKSQRLKEQSELQDWAKDRAKEKAEERLAREKVLAQIAQDRAERAARYQQTVEKKNEKTQANIDKKQENERASISSASNFANIQFRLPDGTSVIHQFPASATLEEARQYVTENIKLGYSSFNLSTAFPRREFTRNDYSQTLRDLQLVPSATVLILPVHSVCSTNDGGGLTTLLWSLLAPFTLIWSYIISYFSGSASSNKRTNEDKSQQSKNRNDEEKREEGDIKTRTSRQTFYQEGNIYRLSNQQGDDDENNTWNGNSTQQM